MTNSLETLTVLKINHDNNIYIKRFVLRFTKCFLAIDSNRPLISILTFFFIAVYNSNLELYCSIGEVIIIVTREKLVKTRLKQTLLIIATNLIRLSVYCTNLI